MKTLKRTGLLSALLILAISLTGCSLLQPAAEPQQPTQDLAVFRTEIARTVVAGITVEAALNPSPTPLPTQTLNVPPTVAPTLPAAMQPTSAPAVPPAATAKPKWVVYPTATRTPYTDAADLSGQSPLDGFEVGPGGDFDIVWTFKNVGLRPWNTQFYIRYLSGVKGSDASKYMLSAPVNVNDTATFRVDMVAPLEPGNYVTTWQLINDDGVAISTPYLSFTVR